MIDKETKSAGEGGYPEKSNTWGSRELSKPE